MILIERFPRVKNDAFCCLISVSGKGYLVMSQICYLKNALYDFDKNVVSDEVVCAGLNALTPVTFFIWSFSQIALENGHFTRTASKTPNPETLMPATTGVGRQPMAAESITFHSISPLDICFCDLFVSYDTQHKLPNGIKKSNV